MRRRTAATPIKYNGVKIGEVEIRHSRKCATVWARVTNRSGGPALVRKTTVLFSDKNGNGKVEHEHPTISTVADGGAVWSHQYRDRASFAAEGCIMYAGAWRCVETARTVAWVQNRSNYSDHPYACNHTSSWPCRRWPILANGLSVTRYYWLEGELSRMPTSSGGTRDVRGDIRFMFNQFNDVPASNPFFYEQVYNPANVNVIAYPIENKDVLADARVIDDDGNGTYDRGELRLSTRHYWNSSDGTRGTLCHEIDHLMGLAHVWWDDLFGVDNVGSKATCIGMGSRTGPRIDDVSALKAVYSGVVP